ncbi:hypothetical protein [Streptomyces sp. RKAG337]|uniref:hypothetical protein n=1 Tax=Streptomyces sp. RKAG337 TaxID=2893404 RepID=UPI0020346385|nr:hypothetical protein [Streptomyces sp. RKAG337]MCM2428709.1 hypothetical protein [Streptomyces sp. RKAG337]
MNATVLWTILAICTAVLLPVGVLLTTGTPLPWLAPCCTRRRMLGVCALLYYGATAVTTVARLVHSDTDTLLLCTGIGIAMTHAALILTTIASTGELRSARALP